jgi:hypothetical protein
MTDRFYGATLGTTFPTGVLESASTTSRDVELRINFDASGANKTVVLNAIEAIKNTIIQDTYPPV